MIALRRDIPKRAGKVATQPRAAAKPSHLSGTPAMHPRNGPRAASAPAQTKPWRQGRHPSPSAAPGQEMLGWGPMSSRALSMDRDPPLPVGLHRTSLDNTSTSCTGITQCNPISWPAHMAPGVAGHRESCGKLCSHAGREQMSGSAGMHIGALLGVKRIWKGPSCMEAQEQRKALVLLMGLAWGRPTWGPSAQWQVPVSHGTHAHCQCQTPCSLWAAFPAFHSNCNSRAPAQQAQRKRSCVRSSWKGQCTMPGSSRSQREMAESWGSHQAVELLSHLTTASAASGGLSHQWC